MSMEGSMVWHCSQSAEILWDIWFTNKTHTVTVLNLLEWCLSASWRSLHWVPLCVMPIRINSLFLGTFKSGWQKKVAGFLVESHECRCIHVRDDSVWKMWQGNLPPGNIVTQVRWQLEIKCSNSMTLWPPLYSIKEFESIVWGMFSMRMYL